MAEQSKSAEWRPLVPPPPDTPDPVAFRHPYRGEPVRTFTYYGPDNDRWGYQCVFIKSDLTRISLGYTYCRNEAGETKWHWLQFPRLRPLYNGHRLYRNEEGIGPGVLLVFDEWSADIAQQALPSYVVVSWPGGIKTIDEVDWTPLQNALFIDILPHHGAELGEDGVTPKPRERQPYARAARKLVEKIKELNAVPSIRVADTGPPSAHPDGWSPWHMQREGWTPARIYDWFAALIGSAEFEGRRFNGARLKGGPAGQPPFGHGGSGGPGDGGTEDPDDRRPEIRLVEGNLPQVVDQAEAALLASEREIYQRAGAGYLVRVIQREAPTIRHYRRAPGVPGMVMVEPAYLRETFTRVARFAKYDARNDRWKRANAPKEIAEHYLARVGEWKLPVLRATVTTPTLRPDGTVLQKHGYDAATKLYYEPCGVKYPRIPDNPTREQAEAALAVLANFLSTLPFDGDVSKAVALAAILTGLVRRSLGSAPLVGINAPTARTGKTALAESIAMILMGTNPPTLALPKDDIEALKAAFSILQDDVPVLLIDNVDRTLDADWLCIALTSEVMSQRVMGKQTIATAPTTLLWLATGNKLTFGQDLRHRTLMCTLDAKMENPEMRTFSYRLQDHAHRLRADLVVAGLTVMRAFIAQKERAADHVSPWGGFEGWSSMVRAPLVWLGCQDPLESAKTIAVNDPYRRAHVCMLEAWWSVFGPDPDHADRSCAATARQAIEAVQRVRNAAAGFDPSPSDGEVLLDELLTEVGVSGRSGKLESRTLGIWIQKHANSPVRIGEPEADPAVKGRKSKPAAPALVGKSVQFEASGVRAGAILWRVVITNPS